MRRRAILAAFASALLMACGGGGGGAGGIAPAPAIAETQRAGDVAASAQRAAESYHLKPAMLGECSITFHGDSIFYGAYGTAQGESLRLAEPPAAIFARLRPKYRVVDRTVSGQTAKALAEVFSTQTRDTYFVVVENGQPDAWGATGEPPHEYLADVARKVKSEGRVPMLTGWSHIVTQSEAWRAVPQAWVDSRAYWEPYVRHVADRDGTIFIGIGDAPFYGASDIMDNVHPTHAYAERMILRVIAAADAILPECAN